MSFVMVKCTATWIVLSLYLILSSPIFSDPYWVGSPLEASPVGVYLLTSWLSEICSSGIASGNPKFTALYQEAMHTY